ncbi:MAG: primosomal protein N' [Planctomycetaceae bacterium]|nr:primosomal protein N' [Planctomycetaceae bacterium]
MSRHFENSLFDTSEEKVPCSNIVTVAVDAGVDDVFSYLLPDKFLPVVPGQRLEVPFGKSNKSCKVFCIDIKDAKTANVPYKLKIVKKVLDESPLLDERLLKIGKWISEYYISPLGEVLSAMLPAAVKHDTGKKSVKSAYLTENSDLALIKGKKQKQLIEILQQAGANNEDSAIQVDKLLSQADVTMAPVKKLLQAGIVKFTSETVYSDLPIVPKGMILKTANVVLNDDQKNALSAIEKQIESQKFSVALLHGVTDSGKTEVYIRAIEKVLERGKSAIVLLPEIALTAQTIQRFSTRFAHLAVLHSQLTASQRNAQWQKIRNTSPIVVIGARSAIFAPVRQLGIIVVDEEHEPSYKQDTSPRYNGRDVAIKMAQITDAVCVLGSATPSLETLGNCSAKSHFMKLSLPKRVMDLPKPKMKVVDMSQCGFDKGGVNILSPELEAAIKQTLQKKEQVILMLNRRGYSNFIFCPSCRYSLKCRNCDVTLTFHKSEKHQHSPNLKSRVAGGFAVCHYCLSQTLVPKNCPVCGGNVTMLGLGTQRLEDELKLKIPTAKVVRVDSDSMQKDNYYQLLGDFDAGKIDILAGTQILAKGLHFPNVTLVGIIGADTSLQLPDFRANERTYQLICQVSGRAGRSSKGGTVYIQTFMPNQPAIKYAINDDFEGFVKEELKIRHACMLPPYGRLAIVRIRDIKFDRLENASKKIAEQIIAIISARKFDIKMSGPMPAAISRIQRFHRMQIILQTVKPAQLGELLSRFRGLKPAASAVQVQVDVDPVNLL